MRLLTVRKIPIRLHSSFVLLAMVLLGWELLRGGAVAALGAMVLWSAIFGSVLLHELGHALAGRIFGIQTRDITLYPFGGVARMNMGLLAPLPEVVVAIAGPAVNFGIAGAAWLLGAWGVPGMSELLLLNLALGIFNLLPAYPMDGGRVLRALLSLRRDPVQATLLSLSIARVFAWGFIVAGVLAGAWSLGLVGAFLLFVGGAERRRWLAMAQLRGGFRPPAQTGVVARRRDELADLPFGHPRA